MKEATRQHLRRARRLLGAVEARVEVELPEVIAHTAYYAMYHALLAILFKKGYESKNHECTINTVEFLIENKEINFSIEDLSFIRTTEQMTTKDAKSLREEFQYGTQTEVNKVLLTEILKKSKAIVEKIEVILSEMK